MAAASAAALAAKAAYQSKKKKEVVKLQGEYSRRPSLQWVVDFQTASKSLGFARHEVEELEELTVNHVKTSRESLKRYDQRDTDWVAAHAYELNYWVVKTAWFETIITGCILLVGIAMGIEATYIHDEGGFPEWASISTEIVSTGTLVVFTVEAILKVLAFGRFPALYFTDPKDGGWNAFDFSIVFLSWCFFGRDAGAFIAVLRLCRLVRVLQMLPQLRVILRGLFAGLQSVGNIMLLLVLTIYMFGVIGVTLFSKNDPVHFHSVTISMLTLFRCSTLAGWSQVFHINYYGCAAFNGGIYATPTTENATSFSTFSTGAGTFPQFECIKDNPKPFEISLFMFVYSILTAFVIISLFIGVITMGMFDAIEVEKSKTIEEDYKNAIAKNESMVDPAENPFLKHRLDQTFGRATVVANHGDLAHLRKRATRFGFGAVGFVLPPWCVCFLKSSFCRTAK